LVYYFKYYNIMLTRVIITGDSGYASEPWLLTPILRAAVGSPEDRYTKAHCKTRSCIERLYGVLKATFRCLRRDRVLHYQPKVASDIIITCCVLYNMMHYYKYEDFQFNLCVKNSLYINMNIYIFTDYI
jgi:hypothetical protein